MRGASRSIDHRRYAWRTGQRAAWGAWIAASAAGGALLLGQICVYVPPVYPSLDRWVAPSVLLATPVLALVPQWLVLRRRARRLCWWVPLTLGAAAVALVASGSVALLLGAAVWQLALASQPPVWLWLMVLLVVAVVVGFVTGVALGAVQLAAYRRHLGSSRGWLVSSGVFLAIFAVPLVLLFFMAGQDLIAPIETCSSFGIGAWVGVGLAWGALYGALTGIPLAARSPGDGPLTADATRARPDRLR